MANNPKKVAVVVIKEARAKVVCYRQAGSDWDRFMTVMKEFGQEAGHKMFKGVQAGGVGG